MHVSAACEYVAISSGYDMKPKRRTNQPRKHAARFSTRVSDDDDDDDDDDEIFASICLCLRSVLPWLSQVQ